MTATRTFRFADNRLNRNKVPFREELTDGKLWFLIPRAYRPHAWKLRDPAIKQTKKSRSP